MSLRLEAVCKAGKKQRRTPLADESRHSTHFASRVFHSGIAEQMLPKKVAQNLQNAREGREKFDPAHADAVAEALKEWAVGLGATHYTHWFQPLTGAAAEKHDAFLSWDRSGTVIEKFRGKELLRGEPDASSFPSGGARATHEARGYTMWDPSLPPFLWESGEGLTLCIPSLYFSWKGEPLDQKIPLLRSDQKIQSSVLRLLHLAGVDAARVFSTLGPEQEYFAIDRSLFLRRPDLMLAHRTVFGAKPPKGQELEDHYFGSVKDRVLSFMREFENGAVALGIPIKTRHNEVAPAQHEVAPLFERASLAIDHNLLLMELMRQTATHHDLACLLHEKPFAGINGSGKHCNWSLATDTGLNLLDPEENSLVFLTLLTAVIHAVHEHAPLLRSSIASAGNDHRLGGSEAPPTIISIYLGEALERTVEQILSEEAMTAQAVRKIDLSLAHVPHHIPDASDRNRTSFFAFTGNKFEFRAVGSSAHCALPVMVINAIVSDSLQLILDEVERALGDAQGLAAEKKLQRALPVLRKNLHASKAVLFSGNGYSAEWEREAEMRGLPNIRRSFHALHHLLDKKAERAFAGILSPEELHSRYEILVEQYAKSMNIEANLMIEMFRTQILPAALRDQKQRAEALHLVQGLHIRADEQLAALQALTQVLGKAMEAIDEVERVQKQTLDLGWEAKARIFCELVTPKMGEARGWVDRLETMVEDALWPLPKYREMLYLI